MQPSDELTPDVRDLYLSAWHALQRDDLNTAEASVAALPAATRETATNIGSILVTAAFRLECAGHVERACTLYRKVVDDKGLSLADRTNGALRLALLTAEASPEASLEHLRLAIASPDPGVHAAASLHLVHALLNARRWAEAFSLCTSERVEDPALRRLFAIRALQCQASLHQLPGEPEDAAASLPEAVAADAAAWTDAAVACEAVDNYALARLLYERLLTADGLPADVRANAQFRLGFVLDRLMLWNEAEPWLAESLRCEEAWPGTRVDARFRLAAIYYLLDRYDLALVEYDKLRADNDADTVVRAAAQLKHATCLHRLGRTDEATKHLRECRSLGGEIEVTAELMLAEIAEALGDMGAARDSYNRVIQHPQSASLTKNAAFQRLRNLPRR